MITSSSMSLKQRDDSELVRESLQGDRDAFGHIVTRYQSLVCSLAYSATGSLSRSEDLAQETFLAAWRQLPELREPSHLRSWLCGIARNLISNSQRHASREPTQLAQPLDLANEFRAETPSPTDQAISGEEEALLWHALEKIPELYREPLILFYREHRSVAQVALLLDISEDAVKQRLLRGRALLQAKIAAFVEGTLARSAPGRHFALDVMAALPASIIGTTTPVALGMASGKAGTGTKASSFAGLLGFWSVISGFFSLLGGLVGYQMSDTAAASHEEQLATARFWRWLAIGIFACILPVFVLLLWHRQFPWLRETLSLWLCGFYALVIILFARWAWHNSRRARGLEKAPTAGASSSTPRRFPFWAVITVTVCMAAFLTFFTHLFDWKKHTVLPQKDVITFLAAHPNAKVEVLEYESNIRSIWITVNEGDRTASFRSQLSIPVYNELKNSGRAFRTLRQGSDFEILGAPGRYFSLVVWFVFAAGVVILFRHWRRRRTAPAIPAPSDSSEDAQHAR